jgi:hypothetical protein
MIFACTHPSTASHIYIYSPAKLFPFACGASFISIAAAAALENARAPQRERKKNWQGREQESGYACALEADCTAEGFID